MRRWPAVLIVLALAAMASAQAPAIDPLLAAHETDPLELARVVDRIGDAAILSRLTPETPIAVRAIAVVAAPRMHAPEDALAALTTIAAGRDPDLAPRAAQALLTIARSVDAQALDAREHDRGDFAAARTTLSALATDETARADIRLAARWSDSALAELVVSNTD